MDAKTPTMEVILENFVNYFKNAEPTFLTGLSSI